MDRFIRIIKDFIVPLLIAGVLAYLINVFVFFKAEIPTGSMLPAIQLHSQVIVTRIYNFNKIKRQDILVFYSDELKETLIKRVIGLPGDTVEVKEDGSVYVNGSKLDEPYVQYTGGSTGDFKVPEGKYFFLGDNRANSLDSRYWSNPYISKDAIKGKGIFTVYPFDRIGVLR